MIKFKVMIPNNKNGKKYKMKKCVMPLLVMLILSASLLKPADSSFVKIKLDGKEKSVQTIRKGKTFYFSLNDFSRKFRQDGSYSAKTRKYDINTGKFRLRFSPGATFGLVITLKDTSRKSFQMLQPAFSLKNDVYVPAPSAFEAFEKVYGEKISFRVPEAGTRFGNDKPAENDDDKPVVKDDNKPEEDPGLKEEVKNDKDDKEAPQKKPAAEAKGDIKKIEVEERANGTLVYFYFAKGKLPSVSHEIAEDDGKKRIEVLMKTVEYDKEIYAPKYGKGLVSFIDGDKEGNGTLVKIGLKEGILSYDEDRNEDKNFIRFIINGKVVQKTEPGKENWKFDVVVLDAGHGGKDHGAIGTNKVREKDVNLAVTLRVGELIKQNMKGVKVVYTREKDEFVELVDRGKIANKANGKLFVSFHCNSTPEKPSKATGYEVYLLRPGKTKDAIAIAEFENSVIQYESNPSQYKELNEENFILVTMAHASYMKYSEKFAEILNENMSVDTRLKSRGIKQAGFYVLVGASMPGVLIELGFISNPTDEKYLASERGKSDLAMSIYNSIKAYKEYYDSIFEKKQ